MGQPHKATVVGEPVEPLPHVGRGPRAQPGRSLAFPHTASVVIASFLYGTLPPLAVMADRDPPSPMRKGKMLIRWFRLFVFIFFRFFKFFIFFITLTHYAEKTQHQI